MVQSDITVVSPGKSRVWSKNKKAVAKLQLDWELVGLLKIFQHYASNCAKLLKKSEVGEELISNRWI